MLVALAVKAVAGGLFVCLFALIGEVINPKHFAGLFSAAPSVALAGLVVTIASKGIAPAVESSQGMMAGAVAFVCFCALAAPAVRRLGAIAGSLATITMWFAAAFALYGLVLR